MLTNKISNDILMQYHLRAFVSDIPTKERNYILRKGFLDTKPIGISVPFFVSRILKPIISMNTVS